MSVLVGAGAGGSLRSDVWKRQVGGYAGVSGSRVAKGLGVIPCTVRSKVSWGDGYIRIYPLDILSTEGRL